jgi:hypothetical protein
LAESLRAGPSPATAYTFEVLASESDRRRKLDPLAATRSSGSNDTPLVGKRGATLRRSGVQPALPVELQPGTQNSSRPSRSRRSARQRSNRNARGERHTRDAHARQYTRRLRRRPRRAAHRRTRRNARGATEGGDERANALADFTTAFTENLAANTIWKFRVTTTGTGSTFTSLKETEYPSFFRFGRLRVRNRETGNYIEDSRGAVKADAGSRRSDSSPES